MFYQRISHLFVQQLQSSIIEDQNLYNDVERCDVGKGICIVRLKSIHISRVRSFDSPIILNVTFSLDRLAIY